MRDKEQTKHCLNAIQNQKLSCCWTGIGAVLFLFSQATGWCDSCLHGWSCSRAAGHLTASHSSLRTASAAPVPTTEICFRASGTPCSFSTASVHLFPTAMGWNFLQANCAVGTLPRGSTLPACSNTKGVTIHHMNLQFVFKRKVLKCNQPKQQAKNVSHAAGMVFWELSHAFQHRLRLVL